MVWGMNRPPFSNGFDLRGEFEGPSKLTANRWRQRLHEYYADSMSTKEQAIFRDEQGNGAHWYASFAVNKFLP